MAYKRYIEKNGRLYGPYVYHSRKINGKVISEYHGKGSVKKKNYFGYLLIGFVLAIFLFTGFVLVDDSDSFTFFSDLNFNSIKTITGFVTSGEIELNKNQSETPNEILNEEIIDVAIETIFNETIAPDQTKSNGTSINNFIINETNINVLEVNETILEIGRNITLENSTIIIEENFTENIVNKTFETGNQTNVDEAILLQNVTEMDIIDVNITNDTKINFTDNKTEEINVTANFSIETIQFQAIIGQPVKWQKNIFLDNRGKVTIKLPKESKNIIVKKVNDKKKKDITSSSKLTGAVISSSGKNFLFRFFEKLFEKLTITGGVIITDQTPESVEVIIDENATEFEITYETPGPEAFEQNISNGKRVIITGPDNLNYTNILAYTQLPEEMTENQIRLYWVIENEKLEINTTKYDKNNNSLIDYIEWIVPHLSNQTYDLIIEISKAEHLDGNRTFVEDVYDYVKEKDNSWISIPKDNYLRITFEKNLTSEKDITIYAKSNSSASIEVYEKDGIEKIAEFENINNENWYKIYLTNLTQEQDIFDLKIINNAIEFDYVVDPASTYNLSFVPPTPPNATITTNTSAEINVTILNASELNEVKFNWNSTNYTMYNDSLVLMMNFDNVSALGENDTFVVDMSKYGNNGSCSGTSCPTMNLTGGKYNGAFEFDGIDDFVNISNSNSINISSEITISVWVKGGVSLFGDGSDGSVSITSATNINTNTIAAGRSYADGIAYRINAPSEDVTSVTRYSGSDTISNGISVGDEVLIINMQGITTDYDDTGNYEFKIVSGINASTINFTSSLRKSYDGDTASNQKVIIQRVPHYVNVTLSGSGSLTAQTWDGLASGPSGAAGYDTGIVAFRANQTVNVGSGRLISVNGQGTRGGSGSTSGYCNYAYNGEGINQPTRSLQGAENVGGGEGGDSTSSWCVGGGDHGAKAGGGASYGSSGTGGGGSSNAGNSYGSQNLSKIYLGSGAGGSSSYRHSSGSGWGGAGGNGGGIIMIFGSNISNSGTVSSNGNNGAAGVTHGGGGGGGSGGSIYFISNTISLGTLTATGGSGGWGYSSRTGGSGGDGRIRLDFSSLSGSTSPANYNGSISTLLNKKDSFGLNIVNNYYYATVNNKTFSTNITNSQNYHHFIFSYNSSLFLIYLDGIKKVSEELAENIITNSNDLIIGNDGNFYFNGTIDEVRIWNRSLSTDEVTQQYMSNLRKYDIDKWNLYVNQSKNSTTGLDDGTYTYFSTAKDNVGNENLTETRYFTVDTTNPLVDFVDPTNSSGVTVGRDYVEINVSVTDENLDTITINLYNSTNDLIETNSSLTNPFYINYSSLSDGLYYYNSTANDTLGQSNSTETRNITLDTLYPQTSFVLPTPANDTTTTNTSVEINVTILNVSDLNEVKFNWNSTNYTMYDDSLVLMMNFDNFGDEGLELGNGVNDADLTNGLVGLWHLNNNNTNDSSGNGNNGTQEGGLDCFGDSGKFDDGCTFDGSNDYINISDSASLDITENITLMAWINPNSGSNNLIVGKVFGNSNDAYLIRLSSSNLQFQFGTGPIFKTLNSNISINNGVWTQVVATYDKSNMKVFVDGVYAGNLSYSGSILTTALPLNIGRYTSGSPTTFNGSIDEVAIWNRSLTEDEIQEIYNRGFIGDRSKYGNNGSIVGTSFTTGKYQQGFTFDGVDDFVNVSDDNSLDVTNEITIEMWLYQLTESTAGGNGVTKNNEYKFGPYFDSNYLFRMETTGGSWGNQAIFSNSSTILNEWAHIAVTYNSSSNTSRIYINGNLDVENTTTINGTIETSTNSLWIGRGEVPFFNGTIDEVRIWNRSLSADEVQQQYFSNLRKYDDDKWLLYVNQSKNSTDGLDDGTYTYFSSAKDNVGNENLTETRYFTVDTTNPFLTLYEPQNQSYTTDSLWINFTVSDTNLDACWYTNDSGTTNYTLSSCENTTYTASQDSTTIVIYANDTAGNLNNTNNVTFFVDSINPQIDFQLPTNNSGVSVNRNYIEINVTASDSGSGLDTITIYLYNSSRDQIEMNTSSISPFYINYSGLSDGIYYYNATANDTLNNENSTETRNITIDTTAPNITTIYPNSTGGESYDETSIINVSIAEPNDQIFNLTFTNGSVALTEWFVDSAEQIAYENLSQFNWTGSYSQEGNYLILVNVSTVAGNDSQNWNLTVDNTVEPPAPGGGGGSSCSYDWDCTSWYPSICPENGIQERLCVNRGTCTGVIGMPSQNQTCIFEGPTEPLFDLFANIPLTSKIIPKNTDLEINVELINVGKLDSLDVFFKYTVVDENNTLITELQETRAISVGDKLKINLDLPDDLEPGTYRVFVQITYDDGKLAVAEDTFIITRIPLPVGSIIYYLIISIIIVSILLTTVVVYDVIKKRKDSEYAALLSNIPRTN